MLRFVVLALTVSSAFAGALGPPAVRYGGPPPPQYISGGYQSYAPAIQQVRYAQAAPVVQQVRYAQAAPVVQQVVRPTYIQSAPVVQAAPLVQSVQAVHAAPVLQSYAPAVQAISAAPVAVARPVAVAQPVPVAQAVRAEPFDPHPQYSYGYSVSDSLTGDQKSAHETRDGDVVQGQYSLVEPDGAVRTVTYTADSINGFNAVVDRQRPGAVKAVAAPVAPIAQAVHAHAPISALSYAQPPVTAVSAGRAIIG